MRYNPLIIACLLLILPTTSICLRQNPKQPKPPKPQRAENAQIVIGNLAQMIGQVGNIIESPRDADNVGNSVANMVSNIVKITMNAVQKKKISVHDAHNIMDQLFVLCKNYDENIVRNLITKRKLL